VRDQARISELGHPNSHIVAFVDHVDEVVRHAHVDVDLGITGEE